MLNLQGDERSAPKDFSVRPSGPDSALPRDKRKQKKINIDEAEGKSPFFSLFVFLSFLFSTCGGILSFALPLGLTRVFVSSTRVLFS